MSEKNQSYIRFSLAQRVEHFVLILSFTILGLTGLPQKYPTSPVSVSVVDALGGIEAVRTIHHVAATVFLIEAIYHLILAGYKVWVRRQEASMVPTIKDGTDALQAFLYNMGFRRDGPRMPRYNFAEKAEYWAMIWGLLVMAVTGFMLWNPILVTNFLPGEFIPAAKVAHGGEAVLAVLAIILWHFYNVHMKFFNKSMFTGKMKHHQMEEEHALELAQIEAGSATRPVDPEDVRRRMTIYVPVASIVSIILLAGVAWFVTYEETSITTVPPAEQAQIFVQPSPTPQPPTPTPAPTQPPSAGGETAAAVAWANDLDTVFTQRCGSCHGSTGGFSAESYDDVLEAITPGDPGASLVVTVQESGHPGNFSEDELARVAAWIEAGAPEQGGEGSSTEGSAPSAASATWTDPVAQIFRSQCGVCHGSMGGFSAATYKDVMKAIEPGSPEESEVVEVQQAGNHPGKFKPEQMQTILDWIAAGAPE